jgi:hypothetical protein
MNIETSKITISTWLIILLAFLCLTIAAAVWYFYLEESNIKLIGLVGGVVSGLIVSILTFVTSIRPLQRLAQYERMGIKNILTNRHDKTYYSQPLARAEKSICVMGASCTRFVEDFLDSQSDDRVLVESLRRHRKLNVQLLAPDHDHLSADAKLGTARLERKLEALRVEFGDRVQLRRFPNIARHSFVIADDDLIAGPIFEEDDSKYAPAVHLRMSTPFGQKYKDYFDRIWSGCAPIG